jgi:hypothetical protein
MGAGTLAHPADQPERHPVMGAGRSAGRCLGPAWPWGETLSSVQDTSAWRLLSTPEKYDMLMPCTEPTTAVRPASWRPTSPRQPSARVRG